MNGARVCNRFIRGCEIGFANDFNEGCAGPVEVNARVALEVFMQGLACVFTTF